MRLDRRALIASASLAGAVPFIPGLARAAPTGPSAQLNALLADALEAMLAEMPENATYRGLDTGPRARLRSRLTDRSEEGAVARGAAYAQRLRRLKALDRDGLSGADAVTYDCVLEAHEQAFGGAGFGYGDDMALSAPWGQNSSPYAASQMTGAFQTIPDFLDGIHPVAGRDDAEAWLERVEAYGTQLDQETERLGADAARGVIAPDFILENLAGQIRAQLARPTASWAMIAGFRAKAAVVGGRYAEVAEVLADKCLRPALEKQLAALTTLRAKATPEAGVWKLPQGEAYYAWQLRCGTSTSLDAEAIHQLGLGQVADIERRMDELLKVQGLTQGGVGARMAALGRDPRFLYPNTEAGRAQVIDDLNRRIAGIRPRLKDAFHMAPEAQIQVRAVPTAIQDGAPLGYAVDGPPDGSRPASYFINLKDTANWPRFILPTLTYHETLPGHVWQGAAARGLPPIRSLLNFNAYGEGWALYAEQLADELGAYEDDPFGRLGYLQAIQFRACRLVVDTGLHARRWSRDQAYQYLIDHTGRAPGAMRSEVDRYCATPGQACGYKIGHSEINRLRAGAATVLGGRFDPRRFNDVVASAGGVPLTTLARMVDEDVARALTEAARPLPP